MTDEILKFFGNDKSKAQEAFAHVTLNQLIELFDVEVMGQDQLYRYTTALRRAFMDNPTISRKPLQTVSDLASLPDIELRNYSQITGSKHTSYLNKALFRSINQQ